jgi:hypothetical protein
MASRRGSAALLALAGPLCALALVGAPERAVAAPTAGDPHDISGLWMNENTLDERLRREGRHRLAPGEPEGPPPEAPPLTPEYQALYAKMQAEAPAEGAAACKWVGMPDIMGYPYPFEALLTPGRITLIFEADSQVRRIWLDRAQHLDADDLDPSFYGDSIGHWEGETLVVDTIGFNTETTLHGVPHSNQMHIEERLRHTGPDTLEDQMTITDPKALTRPIVKTITYGRRPDWRIHEYSCTENNRDAPDAFGQRSAGVVPAPAAR